MKKILICLFSMLLVAVPCFAAVQYSEKEINDAYSMIFDPAMIDKALQEIQGNPQIIEQMIQELQNNPNLMNQLKRMNNDEKVKSAVIQGLQRNPAAIDAIAARLINDPEFAKKVLINMGQDAQHAYTLSNDSDMRQDLADKVKNDPTFMQEVYNLLNGKK